MISDKDREIIEDMNAGIRGNYSIEELFKRLSPYDMLELIGLGDRFVQINLALCLPSEYLPKMLEVRGMDIHPAALIEVAGRMHQEDLHTLKKYVYHYNKGKGMDIYTADMLKEILAARMLSEDKIFLMRDRDENIADLAVCSACGKRHE